MSQTEFAAGRGQNITLSDRRVITVSGAEDVVSFDDGSVVIQTTLGMLTVDGEGLHIVRLNTDGSESGSGDGTVIIEGNVAGIFYMDEAAPAKNNGWFRKKGK